MARVPRLTRSFREVISRHLQGGSSRNTVAPLGKASKAAIRAGVVDKHDFKRRSQREAAIFVPLIDVDGAASLLFTQRTDIVSTHKNQVSFPGGHIDEGETVTAAAVREFCEEILHGMDDLQEQLISAADATVRGDERLRIEILGTGLVARAVTGTLCTCVVGFLSGSLAENHDWQGFV